MSNDGFVEVPGTDGGLLKKILREGSGDEYPQSGNDVSVHYVGTLTATGEKFDSSRDRGDTFDFTVGIGSVIKGWDVGILSMKKGELCILRCRADYAYGDRGSPPKIPGGASLDFEVELFSWKVKEKELWQLTIDEKVEKAAKEKLAGNALFKDGKYAEAKAQYDAGLKYTKSLFQGKNKANDSDDDIEDHEPMDSSSEEKSKARDVTLALALNAAQARLKLKDELGEAVANCTLALTIDSKNVKALYRRGQVYLLKGDLQLAKADLLKAQSIEPSNTDVAHELKHCEVAFAKARKAEKELCSKMFG